MYHRIACLLFAALLSLTAFSAPAAHASDWPGWRGPERTDISTETGLLQQWPAGGPKRVWMFKDAGIGYSGFAVVDGVLYTMGAFGGQEFALAIHADTGRPIWKSQVGDLLTNGWGDGPRSSPTVSEGKVYVMGGRGDLACLDAKTGRVVWKRTMSEFGGKRPGWGYCESVLVDGDKVVCTPGGREGAIVALNKHTGEMIWQSSEFTEGAQYASIIAVNHAGVRQYIQLTMKALAGVDAKTGKLLWKTSWPGRTAVIPTPIYHDGKVYMTSGYGVGCKLVTIDQNQNVSDVWENKTMKNHHGGVILLDGYLYGYSDGPGWVCQSWETGEMIWNEKRALGKGAISYADNRLYCLSESRGEVVLIEASPKGWKEHGRFTLSPQSELRASRGKVWTHPVISGGKLYLRDQNMIYCYDVKK